VHITVIGASFVSAMPAACLAEIGHDVLLVDVMPHAKSELEIIRHGAPGSHLAELLKRAFDSGALRLASSVAAASAHGEVHFICDSSPPAIGHHETNLVDTVIGELTGRCHSQNLLVVPARTPLGAMGHLPERVSELDPSGRIELACNSEFLTCRMDDPDMLCPYRIVVGVTSDWADSVLREVYEPLLKRGASYIRTDFATVDLVNAATNSFRATKISFINAMVEVCDAAGADATTLADALGLDPRIGRQSLTPGIGFGGPELTGDLLEFIALSRRLGTAESLTFLEKIDLINVRCRERAVNIARDMLGGRLVGKTIAVLGAAFKPETDVVRDSPALHIAAALKGQGARVLVHDPVALGNAKTLYPHLNYAEDVTSACSGSELVMHLTEWSCYRDLDPHALAEVVHTPRILDGRNALDTARWCEAGWMVRSIGQAKESDCLHG
jgi:UDPglucose 6-dehydrogenase